MASDWATEIVDTIIEESVRNGDIYADAQGNPHVNIVARRRLEDALRIPGDCVRLADGRVVKVLGTLPMTADGVIVAPEMTVYWPDGTLGVYTKEQIAAAKERSGGAK